MSGGDVGRRWWVSWYGAGAFELHSPWWTTGYELGGQERATFCAAVIAADEGTARQVVVDAHDSGSPPIEWRFVEQRPAGWEPFGDRFRRVDWMQWPASAVSGDDAAGLPEPTFWTSDPCPVWSIQPHGSARVCARLDGVIEMVAGTVRGASGVERLTAALRAAASFRSASFRDLDAVAVRPVTDEGVGR